MQLKCWDKIDLRQISSVTSYSTTYRVEHSRSEIKSDIQILLMTDAKRVFMA